MGLRDLGIQSSYETEADKAQLLESFYIPVLEHANKYYRIAGFFSSTSLAVAAKGIEGLIHNGGTMYLLISPVLSANDYATIIKHGKLDEHAELYSSLDLTEDLHENVKALAWLLDNDRLKIKIVVPKGKQDGLFHQKIGIVFDENNDMISFSGSINETAQAWLNNIEEFKVFRSWQDGQIEYLSADLKKFLDFWKDYRQDIAYVFDLPDAIKRKIITVKPNDIHDLNIMRRYHKETNLNNNKLSLFQHQRDAVELWQKNDFSLLMEMATGTGKTRTAIGCLVSILPRKEQLLVIVSTPQNTLSLQWATDFNELAITLDKSLIIDGSNTKWKKDLEIALHELTQGRNQTTILFTTHKTSSSLDFRRIITENKNNTKILFICDEVHAIGSLEQRKALLDCYDYRIGLSATPERMFDDNGTSLIRDYFGHRSFEFTIYDALHTINPLTRKPFLNEYEYHPIFVSLTKQELQAYRKFTQQIIIIKSQDDYDEEELKKLYERRANICKNAKGKIPAFCNLLNTLNPETIYDTITFVSPKQLEPVFDILAAKDIKRAKITEEESTTKKNTITGETERQEIISQFKRHELQVLVGIKCLDEGIDIKNARIAIILSSSINPREFIQRVGRVIRPAKDKPISNIYDFIVTSPEGPGDGILEKEASRAYYIACNALNYEEVLKIFSKKGVAINANQRKDIEGNKRTTNF